LNINKPSGVTSFWVVKQVKRVLGAKKVGHCGTLDPLAEGVLLILFGKATRLQDSLMSGKKTYRTRILLGTCTDTGDITGKVISEKPVPALSQEQLLHIKESFTGVIRQVPPMYSALKHNGRRLYDLAREGITVERNERSVEIYSLEILGCAEKRLELRVRCSRGTYIRTLAEDIGRTLGCGATMESLCRERVEPFGLDDAFDGRELQQAAREELLRLHVPVERLHELKDARSDGRD
jgi:tRNA pseudouridine55 synthase